MINVLIYNEYIHEKTHEEAKNNYPDGIHKCIGNFLESDEINISYATLDDIETTITKEILDKTDVIIWWGHLRHKDVPDEIANLVWESVLQGTGFIALHSAHHSKPFKLLMGTYCNLSWREDGDWEKLWVINPSHPIAKGIDGYIKLDHEEVYAEPFSIPEPDELVFIGNYEGGEVFRAGCCYKRCRGKIFYFQPGHETYLSFYNKDVQTVIRNAVYWAKPDEEKKEIPCPHIVKSED